MVPFTRKSIVPRAKSVVGWLETASRSTVEELGMMIRAMTGVFW